MLIHHYVIVEPDAFGGPSEESSEEEAEAEASSQKINYKLGMDGGDLGLTLHESTRLHILPGFLGARSPKESPPDVGEIFRLHWFSPGVPEMLLNKDLGCKDLTADARVPQHEMEEMGFIS